MLWVIGAKLLQSQIWDYLDQAWRGPKQNIYKGGVYRKNRDGYNGHDINPFTTFTIKYD